MEKRSPLSMLNATIAFVVSALVASILLISALVYYVGVLIRSHIMAMVLIGSICAIVAWLIYSSSLKPIIKEVERQVTTIYEVAHAARRAYEWCIEYVINRVLKGGV